MTYPPGRGSAYYPGELQAIREADDSVTLVRVAPGPMLVSRELVEAADGRWVEVDGDVLIFRGMARNPDHPLSYRYRIVGTEGGWLLTEPIEDGAS